MSCSPHSPPASHTGQSRGWLTRSSSTICLRMTARLWDWVVTTIPSLTGVLQAVMGRSTPSTSTAQIRHAPVGETFCNQHRVGMAISSFRAASRIVVAAGTLTVLPSIVKLTIYFSPQKLAEGKSPGSSDSEPHTSVPRQQYSFLLNGKHSHAVASQAPFGFADSLLVTQTELNLA